jgi:hypothetical protein
LYKHWSRQSLKGIKNLGAEVARSFDLVHMYTALRLSEKIM